jgi:hypothetical protein
MFCDVFLHMHAEGVCANEVFWGLWLFAFGLSSPAENGADFAGLDRNHCPSQNGPEREPRKRLSSWKENGLKRLLVLPSYVFSAST